jgi:hypothetical protein
MCCPRLQPRHVAAKDGHHARACAMKPAQSDRNWFSVISIELITPSSMLLNVTHVKT